MSTILTPNSLKRVVSLREFMQEAIDFLDGVSEEKREATWLLEKAIYEYQKQTWDIYLAPALQQETFYDKTMALIERMHAAITATKLADLMSLIQGKQTLTQSFKAQLNTTILDALATILMDEGIVTKENLEAIVAEKNKQNPTEINKTVSNLMKEMKL